MRPALWTTLAFFVFAMALAINEVPVASAARPVALGVNTADIPGKDGSGLDRFTSEVGRAPAMVMWYQSFSEPLFYDSQMADVARRGAVPLITWEPQDADGGVSLKAIASGRRDAYLRGAARSARAWGKPFMVRFAHEMNGGWYPWGRVRGNSARQYTRAWKHVVGVFRREGATNVQWVWSPNTAGYGVASFRRYYPGDRWVNWVGLDGYNWGAHRASGWRSFRAVFQRSYRSLAKLSRRPMMIAEAGAPEQGGNKARWIRRGLLHDIPHAMPRVRAVVWFDRRKEADWRVNSSAASLSAFRMAARSRLFRLKPTTLVSLGR